MSAGTDADTMRPSRITSGHASRHAINVGVIGMGVIETHAIKPRATKLRSNNGTSAQRRNSSKPSSRGPRRNSIPRISLAIGRCIARARVSRKPRALQRRNISDRIGIAAAGRSKLTPNRKRA